MGMEPIRALLACMEKKRTVVSVVAVRPMEAVSVALGPFLTVASVAMRPVEAV